MISISWKQMSPVKTQHSPHTQAHTSPTLTELQNDGVRRSPGLGTTGPPPVGSRSVGLHLADSLHSVGRQSRVRFKIFIFLELSWAGRHHSGLFGGQVECCDDLSRNKHFRLPCQHCHNVTCSLFSYIAISQSCRIVNCFTTYIYFIYRWIRPKPMPMRVTKQEKILEGAADDDFEVWEYILSKSLLVS